MTPLQHKIVLTTTPPQDFQVVDPVAEALYRLLRKTVTTPWPHIAINREHGRTTFLIETYGSTKELSSVVQQLLALDQSHDDKVIDFRNTLHSALGEEEFQLEFSAEITEVQASLFTNIWRAIREIPETMQRIPDMMKGAGVAVGACGVVALLYLTETAEVSGVSMTTLVHVAGASGKAVGDGRSTETHTAESSVDTKCERVGLFSESCTSTATGTFSFSHEPFSFPISHGSSINYYVPGLGHVATIVLTGTSIYVNGDQPGRVVVSIDEGGAQVTSTTTGETVSLTKGDEAGVELAVGSRGAWSPCGDGSTSPVCKTGRVTTHARVVETMKAATGDTSDALAQTQNLGNLIELLESPHISQNEASLVYAKIIDILTSASPDFHDTALDLIVRTEKQVSKLPLEMQHESAAAAQGLRFDVLLQTIHNSTDLGLSMQLAVDVAAKLHMRPSPGDSLELVPAESVVRLHSQINQIIKSTPGHRYDLEIARLPSGFRDQVSIEAHPEFWNVLQLQSIGD